MLYLLFFISGNFSFSFVLGYGNMQMKLKQKKNKKLPEIKNYLCNIYVCALNGANKMLLGINQAFISENYHCK